MFIDHVIGRLRAFALHKGWRKSRFATEAGLSDTVLRDFNRPHWNPTTQTLKRLEAVVPADFRPDPNDASIST